MTAYSIRLARVADAEAYVRMHTEALIATYAHIMPPQFAIDRRAEAPSQVVLRAQAFARMHDELASGAVPRRTHWVATDPGQRIVGVVASGPGTQPWEHLLQVADPPIGYQLDHLYTLASTHGSGLGQRLLDAALPDGKGAYLWVLDDNDRADRFYRRNGFVPDGVRTRCGPAWFRRPMYRMWRADPIVSDE